ncbi:Ff.00g012310.m01.CDS01 [Fusarium sp. VM40]|nr:Ff.00g012310.m01.CDS01 [Fusarium sp. VM40]
MEAPDVCPAGDSRTTRELIVKLIVAHLTAVVAFCNLQSLRNERLDTIEPVLFLFSPLIVVVQTALGLFVIHASLIINIISSPHSFSESFGIYARHWNTLFGRKVPLTPDKSSDESLHRARRLRSKLGRAWVRLGRTAAIFGTLFQFSSSIFLYKRRLSFYGWESLTIVDHRTFELAVGGAAVSIMSLALLLKLPGFGKALETEYIPKLDAEATIIFCRGDPRRCPSWYQIIYVSDFGSTTSALAWLFCVGSSLYKGKSIWLEYAGGMYNEFYKGFAKVLPYDMSITTFYTVMGGFFVFAWIFAKLYTGASGLRDSRLWVLLPATLVLGSIFLAFFCLWLMIMMPLVAFGFPAMLSGPTCILLTKVYETRTMLSQVPFSPTTNEQDCFMLWKDPAADYLWSLF